MNPTLLTNRSLFVLFLAGSLAAFAGCGDDSGMTGTDGGGGGTDGGGGGTDGGGGGTDGGGGGTDGGGMMCRTADDYYTGTDNCSSTEDMAAFERADYGVTMDQTASDIAGACARGTCITMLGSAGFAACVSGCVRTMTEDAFSEGCATCYGATVACSADNCLAPCLPGDSEECDMCRAGMNSCDLNCAMMFYDCSGLTPPGT